MKKGLRKIEVVIKVDAMKLTKTMMTKDDEKHFYSLRNRVIHG